MILWEIPSENREPARRDAGAGAAGSILPESAAEQIRRLVLGLLAVDPPAPPDAEEPDELLRRHREALRLYTERLRAVAQFA